MSFKEENFMKKVLLVLAIAAMCGSIAQADTGSCTAGSMVVNFSSASFVTGLGWSAGGSRTITFSGSCSGCNLGPIVYGWGTNPLVEYYIGRSGGSSAGSYSTGMGTFTLYTNSCNGPNITGSGAFTQYNCSGSGSSGQAMGDHYNGWRNLGKGTTESGGYCIVMAESWSSGTGSASISVPSSNFYSHWVGSGSATFTCGGGSGTTTTSSGSTTTTSSTTGNFQAENYTSQSGTSTVSGDGGTAVEYSSMSSYTAYNVNFGSTGPSSITVRGYYSGSGLQIKFYLDSQNGTNFCTVYQSGYGSWFTASNSCYPIPTGTHTVYVKVTAANGQINWFDIPGATSGGSTTTTSATSTSTTTTASSTSTTTTASSTSTTSTASSTSTTSGSNTIVVRARGTSGSESVNVTVGGSTIATWTLSTSMTNRTATTSNFGACNVQFTNDASGRDVQVDYITVNGSTRQAESQATNTGVWQNGRCGGSYSEWLHCNGYIGFGNI
jgi:hypothetical protein